MRGISRLMHKVIEIDRALIHRGGDGLEGADLRRRKPNPGKRCCTRAAQRLRRERVEGGSKPAPDRGRAGSRELLRHDDAGEPGEAVRSAPQWRAPRDQKRMCEQWIGVTEPLQGAIEISLGVDAVVRRRCRYRCCDRWVSAQFRHVSGLHQLAGIGHPWAITFRLLPNFGRFLTRSTASPGPWDQVAGDFAFGIVFGLDSSPTRPVEQLVSEARPQDRTAIRMLSRLRACRYLLLLIAAAAATGFGQSRAAAEALLLIEADSGKVLHAEHATIPGIRRRSPRS